MSLQQVDWGDGTAITSVPEGQVIPDHVYAVNGARTIIARLTEADGTTEKARTEGTVTVPPATTTSMVPNNGPEAGGTLTAIQGTALTGTTAVYFGANQATDVSVLNDATVRATSPPGTGLVNVNCMTRGVATPSVQYNYTPAEEEPEAEAAAAPIRSTAARGARPRRGRP
jgi:hypothetical protein